MLDVLEEGHVFPLTVQRSIQAAFIETDREVLVTVPPVDALLADKLTAFAPNTVGIALTANASMQVAKQVVDVGELFGHATDHALIRTTYNAVFAAENGYRGGPHTCDQAIQDTIGTALVIASNGLRGVPQNPQAVLLNQGRRSLASHLIGQGLSEDAFKVAASRAACIAALIRNPETGMALDDVRYNPAHVSELDEYDIEFFRPLNRLKQTVPEAFFHWRRIEELGGLGARPELTPRRSPRQ